MSKKIILTVLAVSLGYSILAQRKAEIVQVPQNVTLTNCTSINTAALEFSPAFYQNGLVFVSSRYKNGPVDERLGETFFELFYADLDPNGLPLKPQALSLQVNSQLHEGPVTFNRKGNLIFFTRNNQTGGVARPDTKGKVRLKIYQAQKGLYDWENLIELPFNSDNYSCMHPTLSPDGDKLFFASNMPGGYGGRDLYFVEKKNGVWSKPINLGPDVNTEKNEAFPFLHESGVLFFASDGHSGYGGLDLFMIDLSSRIWGKVTNLGKPFNSSQDDLGLILNAEGTRGYFSSNREGGVGKDDIYLFEAPIGLSGLSIKTKVNTFLSVYDAGNSRRMPGASVRVFEQSDDGLLTNEKLYNVQLEPSDKNADEMVLKMIRKKEEELGEPQFYTGRNGDVVLPMEENKDYVVLISKDGYTTQEVKYSTKNMDLPRPIEVVLQPSTCLGLTGTVVSEKFNRPIPNARVRVRNACTGKEAFVTTNIEGKFEYCLEIGCDFTVISEKLGYTQGYSEISTVKIRGSRSVEISIPMTPTSDAAIREPLQEGMTIVLENIYYDFNKSAIRTGEDRELESLARLMNLYPSMEIELIAHTDSRGEATYNFELSLKRAESAKEFLISRGVAANRIKALGYGESRLRNHCKDGVECTDEEH
ncbi:MAG: OmpA family protein, partial [Saprospiraceae bacterium]